MTDSVSADPRIGSEIAGYRIERQLGRGGMAVVYLAYHERLDRHVALKLLAPELAEDGGFRERFLRESRLAASLDHPDVIPIYDADEADGALFIAMRCVEGTDFGRLLKGRDPVEPARVLAILDRVASALDAAHARGLVHRDVKPENVLLAEGGPGAEEHVYLTDFGLSARLADGPGDEELGGVLGSIDYLAPEQIEDRAVSAQTDVYALGCVLYQALTGEAPFGAQARLAVLWAHLEEPPPRPSAGAARLPAELDPVIARAMAKEPEERHESCAALLVDAREALGLLDTTPGLLDTTPAQPAVRPRRRRLVVAAAIIAVAAAAALVPALLLTGGGAEGTVGEDWSRVPHVESVFGGTEQVVGIGLAARDGTLVAVGAEGDFTDPDGDQNGVVWTSTDGLSWTRNSGEALAGEGHQFLNEVAAGPDGFVAVGGENLPDVGRDRITAAVWTSSDGAEWSRVPNTDGVFGTVDDPAVEQLRFMTDVTRGGPGWVGVGWDSTSFRGPAVWTSPDVSWSRAPRDPRAFAPLFGHGFAHMLGVAGGGDGQPLVAVGHDTLTFGDAPRKSAAVWGRMTAWTGHRCPTRTTSSAARRTLCRSTMSWPAARASSRSVSRRRPGSGSGTGCRSPTRRSGGLQSGPSQSGRGRCAVRSGRRPTG